MTKDPRKSRRLQRKRRRQEKRIRRSQEKQEVSQFDNEGDTEEYAIMRPMERSTLFFTPAPVDPEDREGIGESETEILQAQEQEQLEVDRNTRKLWKELSFWDILDELNYSPKEVYEAFGVTRNLKTDRTASFVYNSIIRYKILEENWKLGDETSPTYEIDPQTKIYKITAATYNMAFLKAGQLGLNPKGGQNFIWVTPGVTEEERKKHDILPQYEYLVGSRNDRDEYDKALGLYEQYKAGGVAHPGNELYVFIKQYGTAERYRARNEEKIAVAEAQKQTLPASEKLILSNITSEEQDNINYLQKHISLFHAYALSESFKELNTNPEKIKSTKDDFEKALEEDLTTEPEYLSRLKQFKTTFEKAASAIALDLVRSNLIDINKEAVRYENKQTVTQLHQQLAPSRKKYEDAAAIPQRLPSSPGEAEEISRDMARHDQLQKEANAGIDQLVAQYPILADKEIDREELTQADPDRLQRILLNDARDRKEDIEQSITNITEEPEIIWQLPKIVALTKISLQINDGAMDTYLKMYQADKRVAQDKIDNSLMVLTLGLTILAVVPNPASPLAAYAGTALGGYMTVKEVQDYRVTSAAAGTAFDSAMALSSEDPSLFWLMFSVAMTVVDVSGSLKSLAGVLSKAGRTFNTTQDLSAFKQELDLIKQNKALEQYHKIIDKIEGNLLRAAQNEKDLQKAIGQLAEGIEAKHVLYFMPNDDPKIVEAIKKVAYYFTKQGIIKFDDFLLKLREHSIMKKLKGMNLDDVEVQKQLKEIQEQGQTRFAKNPESYDDIVKKLTLEDVKKGVVKDGVRYFPESELYTNGKHGIDWTEGKSRLIDTGDPQGQFRSLDDVHEVTKIASENLKPGMNNHFDFVNTKSFQWQLVNGEIKEMPVNKVWIRVEKSGRFHAYPYFEK